jgi:Trk-type K+ transport system membrane component
MTDAFYIEEDRNPVEKERKETEMKDIVKTIVEVMIIIAAVTIIAVITQPPSTLGGTPM